jgi:hypothetical protein
MMMIGIGIPTSQRRMGICVSPSVVKYNVAAEHVFPFVHRKKEGQQPRGEVITTSLRMEMAKAAARYVHAKIASVSGSQDNAEPLALITESMSDDEAQRAYLNTLKIAGGLEYLGDQSIIKAEYEEVCNNDKADADAQESTNVVVFRPEK